MTILCQTDLLASQILVERACNRLRLRFSASFSGAFTAFGFSFGVHGAFNDASCGCGFW